VSLCTCLPEALCERCYGRELFAKRGQARVLGEQWAENVGRRPKHRRHVSWPDDEATLAIAARKVVNLTADPRLRAELATLCLAGAAAWWARRPERYR
jgi:hypothetical protein